MGNVLLLRRGLRIVAVISRCPHLGRALDEATIRSGMLICPGHAGAFSVRTGRAASETARRLGVSSPLLILPVRSGRTTVVIDVSGLARDQPAHGNSLG
jgi:nitrite reductase/ring-hydroxylating ferredoxin subunit